MSQQKTMNNVILLAIGSAFLVLSACEKEGEPKPLSEKKVKAPAVIEVEDTQGNNNESSEQTITNNQVKGPYSWILPEGWSAEAASGMRLATIIIPLDEGENLSASVTEFGGSLAGNINRWRRQIGMSALADAEVAESLESVETKLGSGYIALLINPESQDKATLAAIIPRPSGSSVFFKINGTASSLKEIMNDFRAFTQSASEYQESMNKTK